MSRLLIARGMSLSWSIPDFFNLPDGNIASRKFDFIVGDSSLCKCWLECNPLGYEIAKGYVSIFLWCSSEITVSFEISIVNRIGGQHKKRRSNHKYEMNTACGWKKFVKRDELMRKPELLPDGALNINCTMTVEDTDGNQNSALADLSEQFKSLYLSGEHSDVSVAAGGRLFPAHKFVLCARSPVFRAMFSHGMKESCENKITISDIGEDAVEQMLLFIYTGDSPKIGEIPEDLFKAADKYGLRILQKKCEVYMCESLTSKNTCFRYLLSCQHDLKSLKSRIEDFAAMNMKSIVESSGYTEINASHPDVIKQIILAYVEKQQNVTPKKT